MVLIYMEKEKEIDYRFAFNFVAALDKFNKYYQLERDTILLSSNPLITTTYVDRHPEKKWCWYGLTRNPSIPIEYIKQHPEKPWNITEFNLRNDGIVDDDVCDAPNMVVSPDNTVTPISLSFVETKLKELHQIAVARDIDTAASEFYFWHHISADPNLTLEVIQKYYDKPWDYYALSMNTLPYAKEKFKKESLAAYTIQRAYAEAKYNPTYAYCRKLHEKFYNSILSEKN